MDSLVQKPDIAERQGRRCKIHADALLKTGNREVGMDNAGETTDGYLLFLRRMEAKREHVSSVKGKEQGREKD